MLKLYRHVNRTYAFAFLLSALTVYTSVFIYGPPTFRSNDDSLVQRLTFSRSSSTLSQLPIVSVQYQINLLIRIHSPAERAIVYPAVGAIIGAWLGQFF
jgi:phosphatidylinositol glycan class F